MASIPREFHFVYGLREPREPLHLVHYLCLESCRRVNRPAAMHLHCPAEPQGPWWERIRPHVRLHALGHEGFVAGSPQYERTAEGRTVRKRGWQYAHETDFLRLKLLLVRGGVYADIDTLFVQAMPDALYEHTFVLGERTPERGSDGILRPALAHALMLCAPRAPFARRWLERMYGAFDGTWRRHSGVEAANVWREMPDAVRVVPQNYFCKHMDTAEGLHALLHDVDPDLSDVFALHLWAHRWWDATPDNTTGLCAGAITEDYVRNVDTTYTVAARSFLDPA